MELLGAKTFVPELGGRVGILFLASGLSSHKPLLAQITLIISDPHHLGCLPDCILNIHTEKCYLSFPLGPLWMNLVGKNLQKRGDKELMRGMWQGRCVTKMRPAPEELTRQKKWAQIP